MRDAMFDIQGIQPLARTIVSRGSINQRPRIEPCWVRHPCVVRRDSLRRRRRVARGQGDAPDVHLLRRWITAHEVDGAAVGRPSQMVVVNPRLCLEHPSGTVAVRVRDEDRIAGIGGVIDQALAVGRPDGIQSILNEQDAVLRRGRAPATTSIPQVAVSQVAVLAAQTTRAHRRRRSRPERVTRFAVS